VKRLAKTKITGSKKNEKNINDINRQNNCE